jgi:hypothetical protein
MDAAAIIKPNAAAARKAAVVRRFMVSSSCDATMRGGRN